MGCKKGKDGEKINRKKNTMKIKVESGYGDN